MTPIERSPSFRELVSADLRAYGIGHKSPVFFVAAVLGLNKFSVVLLFRIASTLYRTGPLGRVAGAFVTRINCILNSSELTPTAIIGPGLHIPHPIGIGFGPITAGKNLTLLQYACLALRDRTVDHGDAANYPTLGDDVEIGPGAAVIGPVRLGNRALVGANSVVLRDVPDGKVAIGNPARVIHRKDRGASELDCEPA